MSTHKKISFIKSTFRIFAGLSLLSSSWWFGIHSVDTLIIDSFRIFIAGIFFIIAEILGIIEELGEK